MRVSDWLYRKQRLDNLFSIYGTLPTVPPDVRIHWIRYLIVRTSGFLETSLGYFYSEYTATKAGPRVISFVDSRLESPGNMRMERVLRLIKEFGDDWHSQVEAHPDFDRIRVAVNSIVTNRNTIAHGDDVSMSFQQLQEYYDWIIVLLDFLLAQCSSETHTPSFTRRQRR
jgi:hypothetical protein